MTSVNHLHVHDLDDYVFTLAVFAVSLEDLYKMQQTALKATYLSVEEREQATTIAYETAKAFRAINDMVSLLGEKVNIDTKKVAKRLSYRKDGINSDNSTVRKASKPKEKSGSTRKKVKK